MHCTWVRAGLEMLRGKMPAEPNEFTRGHGMIGIVHLPVAVSISDSGYWFKTTFPDCSQVSVATHLKR